jgi:hypothetical protein
MKQPNLNVCKIRYEGVGWIDLAQDKDRQQVNFRVPQKSANFQNSCTARSFPRPTLLLGTDTKKLYKRSLQACFENESEGVILSRGSHGDDEGGAVFGDVTQWGLVEI